MPLGGGGGRGGRQEGDELVECDGDLAPTGAAARQRIHEVGKPNRPHTTFKGKNNLFFPLNVGFRTPNFVDPLCSACVIVDITLWMPRFFSQYH